MTKEAFRALNPGQKVWYNGVMWELVRRRKSPEGWDADASGSRGVLNDNLAAAVDIVD